MTAEKREPVKSMALSDVKIVDFSWMVAGSFMTCWLADHGAVVVRIESITRPDPLRVMPPFKDNKVGVNRSLIFASYNRNKYSAALDMNTSRGIEIAKRFITWADVLMESFTSETKEKWGLTYKEVIKIKSDIIMISNSTQGQTGPAASLPGLGYQLASLAGFASITGWPDRTPIQPSAYTNSVAPILGGAALVAALDYRRRTGRGQFLDLSQLESSLHFVAPILLDYSANRHVVNRMGNRCEYAAPHGIFRCYGDDRWCALAAFTDEEWKGLCSAMGNPRWAKSETFATLLGRKANEDELERMVEQWTENLTAEEVMELAQASGVAAGVVRANDELFNCIQGKHRGHFWSLEHPEIGSYRSEAPPFKLSKTPAQPQRSAPCLGEDSDFVYTKLLGISDDEFVTLIEDGVIK